ncbi:MAG: phosphotransferase [Solirubrobacteraceae bacterium]
MRRADLSSRARGTGNVLRSAADALAGLSPRMPGERVIALNHLTAEHLNKILPVQAMASRIEIDPVSRGTTDRARIRIEWDPAGAAGRGLSSTWFAKATPTGVLNRAIVSVIQAQFVEAAFYLHARPSLPAVVAPAMLTARALPGGRFLLLLEDLAEQGATPLTLCTQCDLQLAEATVDTLARVHGTFWESSRFGSDLAWVRPQRQRAGFGLLSGLLRWGRRGILRSGRAIPPAVRKLTQVLTREASALARQWERGALTLAHGDTHLGNVYRQADGTVGLLDWQVVHRVSGLRDLSYFMTSSLPVTLRRDHERELVGRYLERLRQAGVTAPPSFDEAWTRYRIFAADSWDAVAVTDTAGDMQPVAAVDAAFERSVAALEDLDTLGAIEELLR